MAKRVQQSELPLFGEPGSQAPDRDEAPPPAVLTVAELDRSLKGLLERQTAGLRVRGEVTGLHRAASRHVYFSLRDEQEDALIDCVMYRSAPARARHGLTDGESVVLLGRVTVYPPRGRMQLVAEDLLQTARGALLEALEKLKAKLDAEGLFAAERKRPLPAAPRTIAVLTSPDGAALHDVVQVAFRRGPVRLLLVPTPVQGEGAPARIAQAVAQADQLPDVDIILVTRGGGSAEDLAAYNDEALVRAIAATSRPVVSAVGHEIDVSLTDLVADLRAATPSQAAELLVPDDAARRATLAQLHHRLGRSARHDLAVRRSELTSLRARLGEPRRWVLEQAQRFDELGSRLERTQRQRLHERRTQLDTLLRRLHAQDPRRTLAAARLRLGPLQPRLVAAMDTRLQALRSAVAQHRARLHALSPLAVLDRGYAIATTPEGQILRRSTDVTPGSPVTIRLHQGRLHTRVESLDPPDD